MGIGVVAHGPEAVDSGLLDRVLHLLRGHDIEATVGGASGIAAVIDAGLEGRVDISRREMVSAALRRLSEGRDALLLLNLSKTRESGRLFGAMVASNANVDMPLLQVDDGFVCLLAGEWTPILGALVDALEAERVPPLPPPPVGNRRRLHGVREGEVIWIEGNVVGRALSDSPEMWMEEGELRFEGVEVKAHGLEKVRVDDLHRAIVRSGVTRRTGAAPRVAPSAANGHAVLVDHDAESAIHRCRGAKVAVTVGDDTTRVAASLLYRIGVPVVGITDGDEDGICTESLFAPGSAVVRLRPGNDDVVGGMVRESIFQRENRVPWEGDIASLVGRIAEMADGRLLETRWH